MTTKLVSTALMLAILAALPVLAADIYLVRHAEKELDGSKDLENLAAKLLQLEENALVVGHSNTTTDLVTHLGGEAGPPIVEEWEYERLYLLQTDNGKVTHTILHHLPPRSKVVPGDS
jgi:broad specificity phosphatase PhoE